MSDLESKPEDINSMLESIIFVSSQPISIDEILAVLQDAEIKISKRELAKNLSNLITSWQENSSPIGQGFSLTQISGGYCFVSAGKNKLLTQKVSAQKPLKLTKSQIETLAIIAYRQPITRVEVDDIRGVDSAFAVKKLLAFNLLKILGKSEGLGRPLLYGTTKKFLEFFALNSLNDLPTLKQYDALEGEGNQELDLDNKNLSLKDLFEEAESKELFSNKLEQLSDDALESLDEALVNMKGVEAKNSQSLTDGN